MFIKQEAIFKCKYSKISMYIVTNKGQRYSHASLKDGDML
jgi:hypothetical protein